MPTPTSTADVPVQRTEVPTSAEFDSLVAQYRRELVAHCYRMTGSVYEAEDLAQETYLRAWKAYDRFEGRSSVRTWLHRIATNVCLTNLEGKDRRPLPTGLGAPGSAASDELVEAGEVPWLEPIPDTMVDADAGTDPGQVVAARDSVRLAFVAALQHLPARQRAVLVLRDVLRWQAKEVAEALDTTTAAVNSALQRAHAQLEQAGLSVDTVSESTLDAGHRELLDRYVTAFWDKDVATIVSLLRADAVWEMPPFTGWYAGNENIGRLIAGQCPGGTHDMPMIETIANGQPAFGLYMRQPDGSFTPFHLQVLTVEDDDGVDRVSHVAAFFDPRLFETFGLPASLPAGYRPSGS
ncbi:sigma-70 family RNA polymerase sigma factor [Nocardioides mangrovicus]|uniref:RNA polymerase sigma factor n=1 Tax=Nocardioides mangrovicus TaxID=2478913 RepID=A0A3L8NZ51_9ACTN|nr:sigma-70 family RNA polymerase sigma factor [Nocardioides mangrovicus]RLV47932.1 sigma-70 family RNA polymerase sigma factor [Nocardioides mangrovicus]